MARIRRQEKQREEERKKFDLAKQRSDANVDAAGLKTFGAGKLEVHLGALLCKACSLLACRCMCLILRTPVPVCH